MTDQPNIASIADAILRDALAAIPDGAKALSDHDRQALRSAALLLARATISALVGDPPSEADQAHLRAIRANLDATGKLLAARALDDALTAALGRVLALLRS